MNLLNSPLATSLRRQLTYRIPKKGTVGTEALFQLSTNELQTAWKTYRITKSDDDDFMNELDPDASSVTQEDRDLNTRLAVLKAIYQDKVAREAAAKEAGITRQKADRRRELIAGRSVRAEEEFIAGLTSDEATDFAALSTGEQDTAIGMGLEAWRKSRQ